MYKNMTYQQARRIRNQSISSVLADQLIMGAGYGAAIKQTASAKWNAKISGIKEKFDPLNIIKFMTGGSRLGPAILGKMLGRSRKDIEYFTGQARPVQYRGPKIGKSPGSGGSLGAAGGVLSDILTFLQKSHEDNMTMREKENNFREGQKHEDQRRHESLLKALGGVKQTASPVKTAKPEGPSFMDNIMGYVNNLIDKYKPMLEELSGFMKGSLWPILRVGMGAFGVALIPVIAGSLFKLWWDRYRSDKSESNIQEAQKEGGDPAATATREMEKLRKEGDEISDPAVRDAMEVQQGIRDDAIARREYFREDFLKHSGFKKKKRWFTGKTYYEDNSGREPSEDMYKAASQFAEEETQKIFTGQNKDPLNKFTFVAPQGTKETPKPTSPAPAAVPKTAPPVAPVTPASAAVSTKTSENRDLSLKAKTVVKTEKTNTTNIKNVKKTPDRKISMPAVRNNEETFARLIWDSTRVV